MGAEKKTGIGVGVDAQGGPVIDPTENVRRLTEAEARRQDDLRRAERELTDAKLLHVKEIGAIRATHQHQLDDAESKRLDSIRQIDREEVIKTAAAVVATAETLRAQVASTAQAQATQFGALSGRVSTVEQTIAASGAGSAGEKSGRLSQQDLFKYIVYLILAALVVAAYFRKG